MLLLPGAQWIRTQPVGPPAGRRRRLTPMDLCHVALHTEAQAAVGADAGKTGPQWRPAVVALAVVQSRKEFLVVVFFVFSSRGAFAWLVLALLVGPGGWVGWLGLGRARLLGLLFGLWLWSRLFRLE